MRGEVEFAPALRARVALLKGLPVSVVEEVIRSRIRVNPGAVALVATMRRHGYRREALIETLHTIQQSFGYLDNDSLRYVAGSLRVPLSRAFGVATFYHFFTLAPKGRHSCTICLGTACFVKGAAQILAEAGSG